jgi:hypothetical protein
MYKKPLMESNLSFLADLNKSVLNVKLRVEALEGKIPFRFFLYSSSPSIGIGAREGA